MNYQQALQIAERVKQELLIHCERIEIAGSIRRKKQEVKDIEIVAIPKPYQVGLFKSGIAIIVDKWKKVKGELPCKYTQRILLVGIKLDLFFATETNWGHILAIRTGSAEYSHKVLAVGWVKAGYKSIDGMLTKNNQPIEIREEIDLFNLINLKYQPPEERDFRNAESHIIETK